MHVTASFVRFASRILPRVVLCALVGTAAASAQPVVNPRVVEFDPSADHATLLEGGVAAVERYDFELYLAGATAPFHVVNLGKPAPGTDGKVRVDFSTQVASWPLPGGTYESRVAAVGPGGVGRSDLSNQFQFVTCSYVLSAASMSVGSSSGSTNVTVTAPAGCAWTASSGATWVSMITTSGSGTGAVSFSYATNSATTSRTATLTIAGQSFTLTQAGVPCSYTVGTTTVNLAATATTGNSVPVTATSGCGWTATTTASWLTLTTASGTGSGTLVFSAAANPNASARSATITVGAQTITVTQAAAPCTYSVSPATVSLAYGSSSGHVVTVTAPAGCSWAATTGATWVTLTGATGSGGGTFSLGVSANTGSAARTATITIGGQTVTVTQAPPAAPAVPRNPRVLTVSAS